MVAHNVWQHTRKYAQIAQLTTPLQHKLLRKYSSLHAFTAQYNLFKYGILALFTKAVKSRKCANFHGFLPTVNPLQIWSFLSYLHRCKPTLKSVFLLNLHQFGILPFLEEQVTSRFYLCCWKISKNPIKYSTKIRD